MTIEELVVKIGVDIKDAQANLEAFGKKIQNVGQTISKVSTPFLVAGTAITGALGATVKAAAESEKAQARLVSALKATDQYTDEQVRSMLALSSQMQNLSGVSDEAFTETQAFGLQLGLTTDQVKQLIPHIADLSASTGVDMETAMRAAAMAVQGNTGMLQRYGIQIEKTEDGTVSFNSVLDAFSSYAGAAEAKGKTLQGQLSWVKETFGDLAENVGNVLIPVLKDFIEIYIKPLIEKLQAIPPHTLENAVKFTALAGGIMLAVGAIGKIIGLLGNLGSLFTPTGLIMVGIGAFILLLVKIVQNWDKVKDAFSGFYEKYIKPWAEPTYNFLKKIVDVIEKIVNAVKGTVGKVVDWFKGGTSSGAEIPQYAGGFASGGSFAVSRPTMFLAGERGTEYVNIVPQGQASGMNVTYNIYGANDTESLRRALREHDRDLLNSLRGNRW